MQGSTLIMNYAYSISAIVSLTGNIAVNSQDAIHLYHYSPEQGLVRHRDGGTNVSIPISGNRDIIIASCANDDTMILATRNGIIHIYEFSVGKEVCKSQTGGREYILLLL